MMKNIFLVLILLLPALAFVQDSKPAAKTPPIEALFETMKIQSQAEAVVADMTQQYRSLRGLPPGFHVLFAKYAKPAELVALQKKVYLAELSTSDIEALLAFYRTPAGKNYLKAQPRIRLKSMTEGQAWGQKIAARVLKELNS